MKTTWFLFAVLLLAAVPARAQSDEKYMELFRADLKTQKTALMTENLALTDAQATLFWPIYREYDLKLTTLQDQRIALLKDYATAYENITPEKATSLMESAFALEDKRLKLRKQYFEKISKAVSPIVAARFVHVDSVIQHATDLEIQMEIPMMMEAAPAPEGQKP
jgi:hypothetical protein